MKPAISLLTAICYLPLLLVNIILLLNYFLYKTYIKLLQLIFDLTYNRNVPVGEEYRRMRLLANIMHDAFIFYVGDSSNSHLIGTVVFKLKGCMSLQELRSLVRDRVVNAKDKTGKLVYCSFRQVVRYKFFLPTWVEATDYNINDHVIEIELGDSGKPSLEQFIATEYTNGISFDKPLWKFFLIQDRNETDSFHILISGHHCGADGFAFINLWINYLCDALQVDSVLMTDQKKLAISGSFSTFYQQLYITIATLLISPVYMIEECIRSTWPIHKLFLNKGNGKKVSAFDTSLDFEKVRVIKNQTRTKVNDVFMTILTQALEKYSLEKGKFHQTDAFLGMGMLKNDFDSISMSNDNHKGVIILIPLATKGFIQQLERVCFDMNKLKNSLYPFFFENCVFQLTALPLPLKLKLPLMMMTGPVVGNFANLPGPKNPLFVAGREITEVSIFVPQSGNQSLGVCFLTYAGMLSVAVHVDTANFSDAGEISGAIKESLDELYRELAESTPI